MSPAIKKIKKEIARINLEHEQATRIFNEQRKAQITPLLDRLDKLRKACKHPKDSVEIIYKSNSGGYDGPDFDSYWAHIQCCRCGQKWTHVDSEKEPELYRISGKEVEQFSPLE